MQAKLTRVLHIGKLHWKAPGGIEKYCQSCIESFASPELGIDNFFLYFAEKESFSEREISVKSLGSIRSAPLPFITSRLIRELKKIRVDVIHYHHPNPTMHFFAKIVQKANPQSRLIIHYHSDIEKQRVLRIFYAPLLHSLLRSANHIIATSPDYLASSKILRKYANKCIVLPIGIHQTSHVICRPSTKVKILSIGRLVGYKGFKYLIEAVRYLNDLSFEIQIIGEGVEYEMLSQLIQKTGCAHRVKLLGRCEDAVLKKHLGEASIFVLSSISRAEAFGIVILEAMAHKLPIVTTALGTGTSFLVRDGENGFVVSPKDPKALAEALRKLIESPALREKMGEVSLQRSIEEFSVSKHFRQLKEIYEDQYV